MTDIPATLEVDVAILGAGTAGLAAYRAARAEGARAVIIHGGPHGTTCARSGCMPSKLLIAAANAAHGARHAEGFGIDVAGVEVDGRRVMDRVRSERDRFVGFVVDGVEKLPKEDLLDGYARFVGPTTLEVRGRRIEARSVVVATGSTPVILPMFEGLGDRLIVNDDVFQWTTLPESVAVFGPGVIGLELGQALHRLGVRVRVFGKGGLVGPISDPAIRDYAHRTFAEELPLDPDAKVHSLEREGEAVAITFEDPEGQRVTERFEFVLAAVGRRPNVRGLGLERTEAPLDGRGTPVVDPATLQAGDSPIFVSGDANARLPLLHEAADEGKIAGRNAARFPRVEPGERRAPIGVTFAEPQIGVVGKRFVDLDGEDFVIGEVSFEDQGRSRVMRRNKGLMHLYVRRADGELLGAEFVGPDAEHLAHLLAWVIQLHVSVDEILKLPFYHPVVEEGLRTALRDASRKRRNPSRRAA